MKESVSKAVRFVLLALSLSCFGSLAHAGAARPTQETPAVHALFDLGTPAGGPFPTDWFTVADASHNTRRRVNLPMPDCAVRQSDCEDLNVINTLDGFNADPRLSIPFDGPIDVTTVTGQTVFLISLGSTVGGRDDDDCDEDGRDGGCDDDGRMIGLNRVVWDPETNTLHAKSDEFLDQHTRYALIVTRGVLDQSGQPVEATETFRRFRQDVRGDYRRALLHAIHAARRIGVRESEIVTASVFTTQSVTSILEKIRDQIKAANPEPADFLLGPGGTRTVFAREQVTGIKFNQQIHVDGPLESVTLPTFLLDIVPGAVGTIAFGKYSSPDYEVHPGEYIPEVGTRTGTPTIRGTNEIYFNLFLPRGPKPEAGWPVAIFGHGAGENKNTMPLTVAAVMAEHGIATIAINNVGTGFGPLGTLTVNQPTGSAVTFPAGGRGIDQNGDGVIDSPEGQDAAPPRTIISNRDGLRQTVADVMQLVRMIEVGIDVDGDSAPDLDPSRIYYFGASQGGSIGVLFLAVEPSVMAGVPISTGGSNIEARRLSRRGVAARLASRTPPLINTPGITSLDGVSTPPPHFNENMPLRDGIPLAVRLADGTSHDIRSPVINDVPGAIAIQGVFENQEWVSQPGNTVAYAPHLRKDPLAGVPAKSVIIQFAKGDRSLPNPAATALVRAGDLADRATFYRNDLAFAENPRVPKNPHAFAILIGFPVSAEVARGAQEQIATFFASDGQKVIHPEPARFFEVPIVLPLPEGLNFIP